MLEPSVIASPTRRLVAYMLRYRRGFALGLACTGLSTVASLTTPWVLKHAVDDLAQGVTGAKLRTYASLILVLALVGGGFRFLMRRIIVGVSRQPRIRTCATDFFARLQTLLARQLPREPYWRPDVEGDKRPERGAHDGRPRRDVLGEHRSSCSWWPCC